MTTLIRETTDTKNTDRSATTSSQCSLSPTPRIYWGSSSFKGQPPASQLLGGPVRFVLGESGHIAGIINHPAKNKRGYWLNDSETTDPDQWLESATKHQGSWWVDWVPWLEERSGDMIKPPATGSDEYPPIADAPGTYVLER